jgi:hypothetical protein
MRHLAYWEGGERENKVETIITILIVRYIQFGIYKLRNRKRLPTVVALREEVYDVYEILRKKAGWREELANKERIIMESLLEP